MDIIYECAQNFDKMTSIITDQILSKSKYYVNTAKDEKNIKDRICELQYLEEYLDTNNIIKIFSIKDTPFLYSDIDADYVIESSLSKRNKTVYIFLKKRREQSGVYCIVSFFVKNKLTYGGQKLYWMLKKKIVGGQTTILYQHENYNDKNIGLGIRKVSGNMCVGEESIKKDRKMEYDLQTKEISSIIVQALVTERRRQGFTQQKIADNTGMKTSNVTRFESCKYTPTLEILTRYADALGKKLHIELVDK